jgi:predicted anti-sigma-YlaC factor YlaD
MRHYSEADLLETYYMQPDEASEIIAHVNECNECQDRYRRLAQKLRDVAACPTDKPATFWTRQRLMIMRAVENARAQSNRARRASRMAAAALLAFLLGGAVVYKTIPHQQKAPVVIVAQQQTSLTGSGADDVLDVPRDPWQSDELKDFGAVVAWEQWN